MAKRGRPKKEELKEENVELSNGLKSNLKSDLKDDMTNDLKTTNEKTMSIEEELAYYKSELEKERQKREIEQMKNQISNLGNAVNVSVKSKYIKVISLTYGVLNLSTQPHGRGKVFTLKKFGQTTSILDTDLRDIVDSNYTMAENLRFYICDSEMVEEKGLAEIYKNAIDFETIKKILDNGNVDDYYEVYQSASDIQKQTIVELIVEKGYKDELNPMMIAKFTQLTGLYDLNERIKEAKESAGVYEDDENED